VFEAILFSSGELRRFDETFLVSLNLLVITLSLHCTNVCVIRSNLEY
jgi:hypothetical protein